MADNFVRKTVQKRNVLPKVDFYDIGDFVILNSGSLFLVTTDGKIKKFQQIPNFGHISVLDTRIKKLEQTVADHETRIKALETPAK
nr:MAG TPA: hypothetical protein [Caudoviricetes sp.]